MKQTILRKYILIFILLLPLLLFANNILAKDVPLPAKHTIDAAIDEPQSVFAADMDGDGTLDIIGAAAAANTIAWWQNSSGDGSTWTKHTIDAAFANAEEAHAADIDGDGDLDALGAAPGAGEIAWWENSDSVGATWNKHLIASFPNAMSVYGADIDQDGDIDALGANYNSQDIYWWENDDGSGLTWTSHIISITSWGARAVRTADVDGDGDLDVLSVAVMADDISWWENTNGDGSNWIEHRLDNLFDGARSVQATDLDNDGDMDILGAAQGENRIAWWENSAGDASTWVEHTVTATFAGVRSIHPTDLDQDGDLDIVGAAFTDNAVTWWENDAGDATNWTERTIDNTFGNAISIYPADIDRDGDTDVIGAAELDDTVSWWENETIHRNALYPPVFTHIITNTVDGSVWSETVDMDQDGDLDVLATGYNEGSVSWFENSSGNGTTWNHHVVSRRPTDHSPYMVRSADFDQDGDPDLASVALFSSELSWYENVDGQATSWITHTLATDLSTARHLAIADLDGDGDEDLIATCTNIINSLRWWENQNNGSVWLEHSVPVSHPGNRPVNTADIDNDGDLDIMAGSEGQQFVDWWENVDGVGLTWSEHSIDANFLFPSYLDPADLDQDGDIDILGTGWSQDEVVWWENQGNGTTWIKHIIDGFFDWADTVRAFDVDMDGDLDALGTSLGDDAVDEFAWWENVAGDASTWSKHLLAYGDNATSIEAADLDQDGDLDILGAAFNDDTILWWENRGGQFGLATTDTAPLTLNAGAQDDVLQIVATHNGRTNDRDAELVTFELLLEETTGDPLTDAEANAIIENLHIYLDDGSGAYETVSDTLVTTVSVLTLVNGVQTVAFTDNDPNIQLTWGVPRTYFVVPGLAPNLATDPNRNGVNTIRLTHITEASSTGEDRDFNIPLSLAYAANVTAVLELRGPTTITLLNTSAHDTGVSLPTYGIALSGFIFMTGLLLWRRRIGQR